MHKFLSYFASLLMLMALFSCEGEKKAVAEPSLRPVKYITVGANKTMGKHYYTGLAKARQESDLSFKVSGTINKIYVKVGDRVKNGQLLASLDAIDYQVSYNQSLANVKSSEAQIKSAEAQLESARANFISAQSNYQRFEKLYETNSVSLSDFEQAKSSFASAESAYLAAQTQIEAAQAATASSESMARSASNQVSYTKMKAPFTGVITSVNFDANEVVGQGSPVITINSESQPDVEVGVPENAISEIKPKQKVSVQFNSIHDALFEGEVNEVGYSSAGMTYPVTIRLRESDERIRPGMPASVLFEFNDHHSEESALLVPPSAVGEDENGNFVFVLEKGENEAVTVRKNPVIVGELSDAGFEIKKGIKNGQFVASAGLNVLRDGMQAKLYQNN